MSEQCVTIRRFPILWPYTKYEIAEFTALGCPRSVPWSLLAPHESQAIRNHSQTLERLADRGGLAPSEAVAVLEDRGFRSMSDHDAIRALLAKVEEYNAR